MRRGSSLGVGVAVIALVGLSIIALPRAEATPPISSASGPLEQNADPSPCRPEFAKVAYPKVILLGEEVGVTLTVKAVCDGVRFPLHIVLVLDASSSMVGEPDRQMKAAAATLVRGLQMADNPATMVGVVQFNSTARTLTALTNSEGQAVAAIYKLQMHVGTRIDAGIREGLKILRQGRGNDKDVTEVMVVLSDGGNNDGCAPVLQAASQAKGQGVLMISICVGSGCDSQCMRQVATSTRYYYEAENAGELTSIFKEIRDSLVKVNLKALVVKDTLPGGVAYVQDSARPRPGRPDVVSNWLEWTDVYVPEGGVTYTFAVRPARTGYMPTNQEGWGRLTDNKGRTREWYFQVPWVTVLSPNPLHTPVTPPPTPTPTLTPAPTLTPTVPTPTPSPTATETATPRPKPIYLPILLREHCEEDKYLADVALVLDMSTSMQRTTPSGRTKLATVIESAHYFVNLMAFVPDAHSRHAQVAVAGFNDDAWIQVHLTNDKTAVHKGIDDLVKGLKEGTRLDLAFQIGRESLLGPRRKLENTPVLILLTDGLPNRVPAAEDGTQFTTVLRAARVAKDAGITVFTIGVGVDSTDVDLPDRIDPQLLAACASTPAGYFWDPAAEQLVQVYSQLWHRVDPCSGKHDWGKPWP
jgi:Mg-chelatase subunit ChlD